MGSSIRHGDCPRILLDMTFPFHCVAAQLPNAREDHDTLKTDVTFILPQSILPTKHLCQGQSLKIRKVYCFCIIWDSLLCLPGVYCLPGLPCVILFMVTSVYISRPVLVFVRFLQMLRFVWFFRSRFMARG